jgi:hypothetical protein
MSDDHLRMSDAERDTAAAELGEHYAQGRLTTEEHAERLDRVWSARTRGELAPVFRDLPGRYGATVPSSPRAARRSTYWSGGAAPARRGVPAPLIVVLVVLAMLTVVTHLPLILLGAMVWLLVVARHRRGPWQAHWSRSVR